MTKILQFSGGIDSLACLILLRPELDFVVTVMTDGVYTSTLEYLDRVAAKITGPQYVRRRTERGLADNGHPVDVVPLRWTAMGQLARGGMDIRYQDSLSCCNRAIWQPLDALCRELGATDIYRGQRQEDRLKAPIRDGHHDRGVTYRFPIEGWDRTKVFDYVRLYQPDLMPPGYNDNELTSRDCWDCTAYLQDNEARIENLPFTQHGHVLKLLRRWEQDVATEMRS